MFSLFNYKVKLNWKKTFFKKLILRLKMKKKLPNEEEGCWNRPAWLSAKLWLNLIANSKSSSGLKQKMDIIILKLLLN